MDSYTIRPRKTQDGFDLISERLSHGSLWYKTVGDAIGYAAWHSRIKGAKIDVLTEDGEVIDSQLFKAGDFAY